MELSFEIFVYDVRVWTSSVLPGFESENHVVNVPLSRYCCRGGVVLGVLVRVVENPGAKNVRSKMTRVKDFIRGDGVRTFVES
jgi:hypothetical protein